MQLPTLHLRMGTFVKFPSINRVPIDKPKYPYIIYTLNPLFLTTIVDQLTSDDEQGMVSISCQRGRCSMPSLDFGLKSNSWGRKGQTKAKEFNLWLSIANLCGLNSNFQGMNLMSFSRACVHELYSGILKARWLGNGTVVQTPGRRNER